MNTKPYKGQKVRLNDTGLDVIFGSSHRADYMKSKIMTITYVQPIPMNLGEETWVVEVDDPEIKSCFLYSQCFDPVDTLDMYI